MKKFKIFLVGLTLALSSNFAFAQVKSNINNLNQNNLNQNNLLYRFSNEQKLFLIERCGFDDETCMFMEFLIRYTFTRLTASSFTWKDTVNGTTFVLTFDQNENSPQGFEISYEEIVNNFTLQN